MRYDDCQETNMNAYEVNTFTDDKSRPINCRKILYRQVYWQLAALLSRYIVITV